MPNIWDSLTEGLIWILQQFIDKTLIVLPAIFGSGMEIDAQIRYYAVLTAELAWPVISVFDLRLLLIYISLSILIYTVKLTLAILFFIMDIIGQLAGLLKMVAPFL